MATLIKQQEKHLKNLRSESLNPDDYLKRLRKEDGKKIIVICNTCYGNLKKDLLPNNPIEIGRPGCEDCTKCGKIK